MKSLQTLASVLVVAALAACGGGGGSSNGNGTVGGGGGGGGGGDPIGQPPQQTLLNGSPQVIEYHGDSTIWGYRTDTTGDRIPEVSQAPAVFAAALPDYHRVENRGRNSTTACDLLRGEGAYSVSNGGQPPQPAWAEHMRNSDATVVIINHGINDLSRSGSSDVGTYRQCLNDLIDIARGADKVVILETPNPVSDTRIELIVSAMREVAEEKNVDLIDQYDALLEDFTADPDAICPDGTHPTEAVYERKGRYAAQRFATFASP